MCSRESRCCGQCGATNTTPARTSSTSTSDTCVASSAGRARNRRSSRFVRSLTGWQSALNDLGGPMSGGRGRMASALPAGLRWRLTAWVAGVMAVSAAVVFFVVYQDTGVQLRSQIDRDITGDTTQLLQSLHSFDGSDEPSFAPAANSYVSAQPYTATSTVLFVLMPNDETASNHPELFGGGRPDEG